MGLVLNTINHHKENAMVTKVKHNWKSGITFLGLVIFLGWGSLAAQGKLSGYMFGDFYNVISNHDNSLKDQNGFWFRRIYFTYDNDLGDGFSVRLRTEMASKGDFKTSSKIEPFVKDAYLKWKMSKHTLFFGLSPTPTWTIIEKIWGYRSVEKTPLDLQKFGSSRDFGFAVKGALDPDKKFLYHAMIANGEGTSSENNKGKNVLCSLGFRLTNSIFIEVYADRQNEIKGVEDSTRITVQGFAAYETENMRLGAQFAQQTRQGSSNKDKKLRIASVFGVYSLSVKLKFVTRYDKMLDANSQGSKISYMPFDKTAKSNFLLIGIDYKPHKLVSIVPNIEYVFYEKTGGFKPDSDLIARVTFYYKWK